MFIVGVSLYQLLQSITNASCINISVYTFPACSRKPFRSAACFPASRSPHCLSSYCFVLFMPHIWVSFPAIHSSPRAVTAATDMSGPPSAPLILFIPFFLLLLLSFSLSPHRFPSSAFPWGEEDVVSHLADFTADWQYVAMPTPCCIVLSPLTEALLD